MRSRISKSAHVLERIGLAMAGAASGLFVGALVGAVIPALTTQGFLLIMMLAGAVGFYLGIDTPPAPFHETTDEYSAEGAGRIDVAEFLTAAGTFLATLTSFAAVILIVLALEPHMAWIAMIMFGWIIGVSMQIVAGAIARMRK